MCLVFLPKSNQFVCFSRGSERKKDTFLPDLSSIDISYIYIPIDINRINDITTCVNWWFQPLYPNKNPALPSQAFPPFHHIPSIHWGYNRCSGTGGEDRLSRSWLEAIANDTRCPHLTERNDTKATPLQLTTIYFTSLFWHVVISSLIKFCLTGFLPFYQV